jgi:hypothetical protein
MAATIAIKSSVVRMPEERNIDRQIGICRFGAQRDGVTVLIVRKTPRGEQVVFEITPQGDVIEPNAPGLKASLRARLEEQYLTAHNAATQAATHRAAEVVGAADAAIKSRRQKGRVA